MQEPDLVDAAALDDVDAACAEQRVQLAFEHGRRVGCADRRRQQYARRRRRLRRAGGSGVGVARSDEAGRDEPVLVPRRRAAIDLVARRVRHRIPREVDGGVRRHRRERFGGGYRLGAVHHRRDDVEVAGGAARGERAGRVPLKRRQVQRLRCVGERVRAAGGVDGENLDRVDGVDGGALRRRAVGEVDDVRARVVAADGQEADQVGEPLRAVPDVDDVAAAAEVDERVGGDAAHVDEVVAEVELEVGDRLDRDAAGLVRPHRPVAVAVGAVVRSADAARAAHAEAGDAELVERMNDAVLVGRAPRAGVVEDLGRAERVRAVVDVRRRVVLVVQEEQVRLFRLVHEQVRVREQQRVLAERRRDARVLRERAEPRLVERERPGRAVDGRTRDDPRLVLRRALRDQNRDALDLIRRLRPKQRVVEGDRVDRESRVLERDLVDAPVLSDGDVGGGVVHLDDRAQRVLDGDRGRVERQVRRRVPVVAERERPDDRIDGDLLHLVRRAGVGLDRDVAERGVLDRHRGRDGPVERPRRRRDDLPHRGRQVPLARQHDRLALEQARAVDPFAAVDEQRTLDRVELRERRREHVRVAAVDAAVLVGAHPDGHRLVPVGRVDRDRLVLRIARVALRHGAAGRAEDADVELLLERDGHACFRRAGGLRRDDDVDRRARHLRQRDRVGVLEGQRAGERLILGAAGCARRELDHVRRAVGFDHADACPVVVADRDRREVRGVMERGQRQVGAMEAANDAVVDSPHLDVLERVPVRRREVQRRQVVAERAERGRRAAVVGDQALVCGGRAAVLADVRAALALEDGDRRVRLRVDAHLHIRRMQGGEDADLERRRLLRLRRPRRAQLHAVAVDRDARGARHREAKGIREVELREQLDPEVRRVDHRHEAVAGAEQGVDGVLDVGRRRTEPADAVAVVGQRERAADGQQLAVAADDVEDLALRLGVRAGDLELLAVQAFGQPRGRPVGGEDVGRRDQHRVLVADDVRIRVLAQGRLDGADDRRCRTRDAHGVLEVGVRRNALGVGVDDEVDGLRDPPRMAYNVELESDADRLRKAAVHRGRHRDRAERSRVEELRGHLTDVVPSERAAVERDRVRRAGLLDVHRAGAELVVQLGLHVRGRRVPLDVVGGQTVDRQPERPAADLRQAHDLYLVALRRERRAGAVGMLVVRVDARGEERQALWRRDLHIDLGAHVRRPRQDDGELVHGVVGEAVDAAVGLNDERAAVRRCDDDARRVVVGDVRRDAHHGEAGVRRVGALDAVGDDAAVSE